MPSATQRPSDPAERHVGSFAEGEETLPMDNRVSSFADGQDAQP